MKALGLGLRVEGFKLKVQEMRLSNWLGSGFRVSDFGFQVSDQGLRVLGFGFRVSCFGFRVPSSRFFGFGFRVSGFWMDR